MLSTFNRSRNPLFPARSTDASLVNWDQPIADQISRFFEEDFGGPTNTFRGVGEESINFICLESLFVYFIISSHGNRR